MARFKFNPVTGVRTTVHTMRLYFENSEGAGMNALIRASDGAFWGTIIAESGNGDGIVSRVDELTGAKEIVVKFTGDGGAANGGRPRGKLCEDGSGFLWGVTNRGGTGEGSLFKINLSTKAFTSVANFTGISGAVKGSAPTSGLVRDDLGFLWGTTSRGGASDLGTVFMVSPSSGQSSPWSNLPASEASGGALTRTSA